MMDWQKIEKLSLPATVGSWLSDSGSLTAHCKQYFKENYRFALLNETWQEIDEASRHILALKKGEHVKVREITQGSDEDTFVYGRSILSQHVIADKELNLDDLGSTSLGTRIFQHPHIARGQIFAKEITASDSLYQQACAHGNGKDKQLWGRYSIFTINALKILVYEAFFFPQPSN